jgi:hypothetical protein
MSGSWTRKVRARTALALVLGSLLAPCGAQAADDKAEGLSLEGSVRARYEAYDGGYRPDGATADDVLSFRTIIKAEYQADRIRIGAEIRDSRAYLDDADSPLTTNDVDALQLPQFYVAAEVGDRAEITLGRFVMNLGSKRLVGDPTFRNTANGFTGAKFDWQNGKGDTLTAFYTLPQRRLPGDRAAIGGNKFHFDEEGLSLRFWGAIFSHDFGPAKGEAYVFGLDEHDTDEVVSRNRHLVTTGGRVTVKPQAGFDAAVEGMWQGGHLRTSMGANAPRVSVSAYSIHAEAGYSPGGSWKPRVSVFADTASGDKAGTRTWERFDPLFGPRRGDWGPPGIYGPLGRSNIRDIGAKLEVKPSKRLDAFVEWRKLGLYSATDAFSFSQIRDASGTAGRDAGSQAQARLRYWLVPKLFQIDVGAAVLDKGPFLRNAPNVQDSGNTHYGYMDFYVFF